MTGTYRDQAREGNGQFGGALRRPEADAALPTMSRTAQAGGVVSAHWFEQHTASNATTADLSRQQRDVLRVLRDELDDHVGESARGRRFDVLASAGEPTVVYVWPRYELKAHQTWCVRAEIAADGSVLEHNIAQYDQYGPIWFRKDPVETPAEGGEGEYEDSFELDQRDYVWTWIR